ncbi:stage V sporulation protein B [Bacillus coahuilensis]|uniref:stage V sporulation protein B n=1 Tax=Bacillus coahuilensis TaxID=408580 RepID=UPI00018510BE|nr:stage V sporulation protein B [Bacillus coahuilensis]
MSKFLKGTMILMAAAFITRMLGFVNRIVLARMIGEEGVGLYMMAVPTLVLVITITQLGLPVAISKHVAEAEAKGDRGKTKKILAVSLGVTGILSIIFTPALILLAPYLAEHVFTDNRTYWPLIAISPVIPIIAVSSVLRGYFQGRQNMKPSAISQVIEQVVRIGLIAVLTGYFLPYGIEFAAAGAMISAVIGELASLLYMLTMFKLKKTFSLRSSIFKTIARGKSTFYELMNIALPTTGSRMIGSLSWFFEPIVVANSLAIAGVAAGVATSQYGLLTGYALPLLFLPSFITVSLSTSLVPAISESYALGHLRAVEYKLQQSLRFSLVSGGLAVIILYVLAYPLMELMYGNTKAAPFISLLAPFFLFYYYQGPLQAVLQALNLARAAMINSLIGAVVKIGLIFILASQPSFGIYGAAIAMVVGIMVVTFMHFFTMVKKISITFYVKEYIGAFTAIILSGVAGHFTYEWLWVDTHQVIRVLVSIMVMSILYLFLLKQLDVLKKEDLARLPFWPKR